MGRVERQPIGAPYVLLSPVRRRWQTALRVGGRSFTYAAAAEEIPYCSPGANGNADFWDIVHASCAMAQDGDLLQADALHRVLEGSSDEEVARFHRELVRANLALRPATRVADEVCAPGLGLGADLGADFRSWVIAHGQSAYESVLADPEALRRFPDLKIGCGRGEPFGDAAYRLYLERTGLSPGEAGLPSV